MFTGLSTDAEEGVHAPHHSRLATAALLGEEGELTLLGDVAELTEGLDGLLAGGVLLLGNNTASAGLHEVLLKETTGSVLGSAVEDFGLGADGLLVRTTFHCGHVVLASAAVFTSDCHLFAFLLLAATKKSAAPWDSTYLNAAHDLRPLPPLARPSARHYTRRRSGLGNHQAATAYAQAVPEYTH
jgi:hypothetical protein